MHPYIWAPITLLLCYRAHSHNSLTPVGIITAALTAIAHGIHPWALPFVLLVVFFLAGTRVTKIKKDVKSNLTMQSNGLGGGESPRTHIQVLANSGVATVLVLLHAYKLRRSANPTSCYPYGGDLTIVGIVANYAVVAADTFSSELGILAKSRPRLITSWNLRTVPPGTNGGITLEGLLAGLLGSFVLTTAALATIPFCTTIMDRKMHSENSGDYSGGSGWTLSEKRNFAFAMIIWGGLGSLLDSFLGGWFQQSVIDKHTGKIIEGDGGRRVLVGGKNGQNSMHMKKQAEIKARVLQDGEGKKAIANTKTDADIDMRLDEKLGKSSNSNTRKSSFGEGEPSRAVESGAGMLDNNEVNFIMAFIMSIGAMQIAGKYWEVPVSSIFQ